jgi:hypothetical protein
MITIEIHHLITLLNKFLNAIWLAKIIIQLN